VVSDFPIAIERGGALNSRKRGETIWNHRTGSSLSSPLAWLAC
jgi:hypothetical protein